jgi:hypothetical protein
VQPALEGRPETLYLNKLLYVRDRVVSVYIVDGRYYWLEKRQPSLHRPQAHVTSDLGSIVINLFPFGLIRSKLVLEHRAWSSSCESLVTTGLGLLFGGGGGAWGVIVAAGLIKAPTVYV